jgi:hypothetical protein
MQPSTSGEDAIREKSDRLNELQNSSSTTDGLHDF